MLTSQAYLLISQTAVIGLYQNHASMPPSTLVTKGQTAANTKELVKEFVHQIFQKDEIARSYQ